MKKLVLIFLFIASFAHAQTGSFTLNEIVVNCTESPACEERKQRWVNIKGDYRSLVHLKETLKIVTSDGGYQNFTYQLFRDEKKYKLVVSFKLKPVIQEIDAVFIDRNLDTDPIRLLLIKEGDFFEQQKLIESGELLRKRLDAIGYPANTHTTEVIEVGNKVSIKMAIILGSPLIFKGIKTNAKSSFVHDFLVKKFVALYNKPFDFTKFKLFLDEAQRELFSYGYYLINLDFTPDIKGQRVVLNMRVSQEGLYAFNFKNLKREARDSLMAIVTNLFKQYKRPLNEAALRQALLDHYRKLALLNVDITVKTSEFTNKFKETVTLYNIDIQEGLKTRLGRVSFSGSAHYGEEKLLKMFQKEAFELASIRYYDDEYFDYFADYLKTRYIRSGYVQVRIQGPNKTLREDKKVVDVEYNVTEGDRAYIRKLNFKGLPGEFESEMISILTNKVGKPFNPIVMLEDIKRVSTFLQEKGYYFAEVTNANEESLVTYSPNGSEVSINYIVNPGQVVRFNRVIYLGNVKTKKRVLAKKIQFNEGDLVTPSKTREIESTISATGLFNTVSVIPVKHTSKNTSTDLIVKVSEREYGLLEFAPGYRTDLGIKLSGTLSYQNIGGMNRTITLKSQVNQRLNYQTLDPRRRKEKKDLLEHNTSLNYFESDIFDTLIDFSTGISYQRNRFYSFDADIARFNTTLTRDLTRQLSSSVRYQLENITQTDATEERDNGSFKIGAVTPSLTYDLRNSQTNPVKGAFFNLSCEFANPFFLSQDESDLTINYYKLISRNRFYIPFKKGTVAISMVGGVQENLNKEKTIENGETVRDGYIPNIKVFRLTGMDIVRGFTDEEMNRLPDGQDISRVRVDHMAYLANFKLEPRFFLTDNIIGGVFYDAGRVMVESMDLGELRDSVGLTFKFLTPVGTLDFDYGIKLLRKKNQDGKLEDPGRFHVSIGFF